MNSPVIGVIGVVTRLQQESCSGKVKILVPGGEFESDWLGVLQKSAASSRDAEYWLPSVGDKVFCLLDERRQSGFIVGGFYTQEGPPPTGMSEDTIYAVRRDDSYVKHDTGSAEIEAVATGDAAVVIGGDMSLGVAGEIKVDGAVAAKIGVNSIIEIRANAMVKITAPAVIIEGGLAKVPWPGPTPVSVEVPSPSR